MGKRALQRATSKHILVPCSMACSRRAPSFSIARWLGAGCSVTHQTSDDTYYWHCGTEYKGQQIPLSLCLFNGAQHDLQRIHVVGDKKTEHWVGLYHPRIS